MIKAKWETIYLFDHDKGCQGVARMWTSEGWIVMVESSVVNKKNDSRYGIALTFVPDSRHSWRVDKIHTEGSADEEGSSV